MLAVGSWVQIPPSPPYLKKSYPIVLFTSLLQNATFLVAIVGPCMGLQRGNQMAIQTVYYRRKIEGTGWRYRPLAVGRRPEAAKNGPYFIRVRNGAGKYQWVKHDTEQAAQKAAKAAPVARHAQELGLTVDELTNEANINRISIKTAVENYLQDRRFGRPRSIAAYENAFDQLLENLPRGVRFIDQSVGIISGFKLVYRVLTRARLQQQNHHHSNGFCFLSP
jgi:hypothetical protein